jgi:signal transduction histidine kinase/CheY-like chemotaxis protein
MKKALPLFITRYFFSENLPLEGRVFNLVLGFGFFACIGAIIARIIERVSLTAIVAVGGVMAIIVLTFLLCNKFRIYRLGIRLALVLVCDLLFPLVFFTNGGADSGMAGYFVLAIVLIFLLRRGRECVIMLIPHIVIVLGCYLAEKFGLIRAVPFTSEFQKYVDHIQTILISGFFIGLVIKYQTRIYEKEKEKAEAATRAKADFLANVSHELRTPLNAIIGLGELELRKDMEKESYSNIEKIHNSGLILLNIINDLLDISKIESGRFELIPVKFQAASFINDTININIVRLGSKPIVFQLKVNEALPSAFYGDELRVRQILNNLLSNAFKYTREGKVILSIDFERIAGAGNTVMLICRVEDTGVGIRQEDLGKLFSVYNQVDARSNRHIEGTGLGLSICKSMVEMMEGDISVESTYGWGSIFTVRIKQQVSDEKPIGRDIKEQLEHFKYSAEVHRERRERVRIKMPYARVLVVDDVSTNLDVAKGMMLPYSLTIDCVMSGKEAIALIREETIHYDAIFMDHMMPEMDGIEAVRIIRQEIGTEYAKNIPIIALTANAIIGNDKMFLENGFQDYLSKPINMSNLDSCLNRWVRNRDKEAQVAAKPQAAPAKPAEAARVSDSRAYIEGIDFAEGVQRMGGRAASYIRVLRSYASGLPALLDRIRNFSAEFLKDYIITVHGIKGSSYSICAMNIGKQAEVLEMAAKQEDIETILSHNSAFIQEAEKLAERITAFLATVPED